MGLVDLGNSHTFVVSAYGASPFLEECVLSLISQTEKSGVLITTSTPNNAIYNVASKYDVEVRVRNGKPNIADDWNYAISCCETDYVTIAHQDDVYAPEYSNAAVSMLNSVAKPLIYFSDYGEIREGSISTDSQLLRAKRRMMFPYRISSRSSCMDIKRLPISFGNPICCPSVTYAVRNLTQPLFRGGFRSNLDWDAWERFSRLDGSFVYDSHVRMYHRVHDGSETSACIADNARTVEDYDMLKRFWPEPIARTINGVYSGAQKLN